MEIALVEMAESVVTTPPEHRRVDEIPFDADRMRISTVNAMPEGPTLYCKGAPETVTSLCNRILVDGELRPLTAELRGRLEASQEAMAEQGLRVLAFAYRPLEARWNRESLEQESGRSADGELLAQGQVLKGELRLWAGSEATDQLGRQPRFGEGFGERTAPVWGNR